MKIKVNGFPLGHKTLRFSGGEIQVRLDTDIFNSVFVNAEIVANIRSSDDLMEVIMATDALRNLRPDACIKLTCPYLPYARQDRVCYPGEAFALKVVCDMINAQEYAAVEVWDVHSDVALGLLDRVVNVPAAKLIGDLSTGYFTVVAPDAGAVRRATECAEVLRAEVIMAEKVRDPNTGAITGTVVHTDRSDFGHFLIVDDICDGGRTFIELAKVLKPLTQGRVHLYVTHGIFSNGFEELLKNIDRIYTANSFVPIKGPPLSNSVTVL